METINIKDIAIGGETQQRERINEDIVAEYAEVMRCGAKFPNVTLFFDGAQYWLADGFHRYHAYRAAEIPDVYADVREGTRRDARLFSAGANGTHGQRLTNADKRKSVMVLLLDKEWMGWSDNRIAKHCHVTQPFVSKLRNDSTAKVITVIKIPLEAAPVLEAVSDISEKEPAEAPRNETQELRAHIEQLTATSKELLEENASMGAVMDADDKLSALTAENKKLRELNRVLNERLHGLQNECNEAKRAAKMWRSKHDKQEKLAA